MRSYLFQFVVLPCVLPLVGCSGSLSLRPPFWGAFFLGGIASPGALNDSCNGLYKGVIKVVIIIIIYTQIGYKDWK